MSRLRLFCLALALLLLACGDAEPSDGQRHIHQLCSSQELREPYLDFYRDDVRSHQPELWHEALRKCTENCPDAVNCAPVLSVASWYRPAPVASDPSISPRSPQ